MYESVLVFQLPSARGFSVASGGTSEASLGASDAERRGDEPSQLIQIRAWTMDFGMAGILFIGFHMGFP